MTVQNLSVYTNTSYMELLALTGLESLKTRFERLQEGGDSFLDRVIRWKTSVLNQFTMHEYGLAEDTILELETGRDVLSLEANRNILKRFKAERMVETVQEINKSFQEDLWEVPTADV